LPSAHFGPRFSLFSSRAIILIFSNIALLICLFCFISFFLSYCQGRGQSKSFFQNNLFLSCDILFFSFFFCVTG
jgi:hypothetical protein